MQNQLINNYSVADLESVQIVSFSLGKEEFAINIKNIQEIIKVQPITPVPLTKPYVAGVMSLRGNIIPVINMRLKMGFIDHEITINTRIIVTNLENRRVGFIVDSMNQVLSIRQDQITPPPPESFDEENLVYIEAICVLGERLITLLDINNLLN
jgi:purine-binding chemotaxis protein CheW